MTPEAGISGIAVCIPRPYIDMKDFAGWRAISYSKLEKGLGIEGMSMQDYHQDPAVLGANAAYELMQAHGIRPENVGMIVCGSESGTDLSMPHTYSIAEMLEARYGKDSFANVFVDGEIKAACAGAFEGLLHTVDWIRCGENRGRAGIVVATDIAKYDLGSPGEPTQGAGAVAVLVEENPKALAFDHGLRGFGFKRTPDFWKPVEKNPIDTPVVLGAYSKRVYMRDMKRAFTGYARRAVEGGAIRPDPGKGECVTDHIQRMVMHIPFTNMPRDALAMLYRHERRGTESWKKNIQPAVGEEPRAESYGITADDIEEFEFLDKEPGRADFETDGEYRTALKVWKYFADDGEHVKRVRQTPQFDGFFRDHMWSSLQISRHTGNWYTGSVLLGLASLLEYDPKDLTGMRVGMGAFGSSSLAIAASAVVRDGWREVAKKIGSREKLGARKRLSFDEYVRLHKAEKKRQFGADGSVVPPRSEFVLAGMSKSGWRVYGWADGGGTVHSKKSIRGV